MAQDSQTRHATIVVGNGLLASDPQYVWQLAVRRARGLIGAGDVVLDVQLGRGRPVGQSADVEVPFGFHVLPPLSAAIGKPR